MGWIPVSEGLPDIGVPVLLTDGKSRLTGHRSEALWQVRSGGKPWRWLADGVDGYEWEWEFDSILKRDPVTHWRPLPPLPRGDLT